MRLLQEPHINPHATLVTLCMNAVDDNMTDEDRMANMTPHSTTTKRLSKYLPRQEMHLNGMNPNLPNPEFIKFAFARDSVATFDHIFDR